MKVIGNMLKDGMDEWLVQTTTNINNVNPIVDRIMEDDSVKTVVMLNKKGEPILATNIIAANNYGAAMNIVGQMALNTVKELNPFDEILAVRVVTKKCEIMAAPHDQFNIVVVQHAREKKTDSSQKKKITKKT